jgi:hypothetical protein
MSQRVSFEIPDGMPVIDAVAVVRYVTQDGGEAFRIAQHNDPSDIVVIGLLRSAVALRESEIEGFDYEKESD